jgi:uncharacterized protein (TIGR03435 family)
MCRRFSASTDIQRVVVGKPDFARTLFTAVASVAVVFGQAQTAAPRRVFEVTSVKVNKSGPPTGTWTSPISFLPGGRFTATNVTLVDVITQAYITRRIQMQGGPDWIDSGRFDIVAKADAADGEVTQAQRLQMVQALLEDRFKLVCHRETKNMPVLALVGKLPAAFQESKEGEPAAVPGDRGKFTFRHWPITGLVNLTSNVLRTPVVDGTGIHGYYDFSLDPMQFAEAGPGGTPGPAPSYADLFETALREQLGLRLERRKAPLEMMVIDSASRPTEN